MEQDASVENMISVVESLKNVFNELGTKTG